MVIEIYNIDKGVLRRTLVSLNISSDEIGQRDKFYQSRLMEKFCPFRERPLCNFLRKLCK